MDLVYEEDVPVFQIGEDGGHVAGAHQGGARGDAEADAHLGGDDAGERRLAQPGRAGEEEVVGGLTSFAGSFEQYREALSEIILADELGQAAGPQAGLELDLGLGGDRVDRAVPVVVTGWLT
jgi:hypothetical protein